MIVVIMSKLERHVVVVEVDLPFERRSIRRTNCIRMANNRTLIRSPNRVTDGYEQSTCDFLKVKLSHTAQANAAR